VTAPASAAAVSGQPRLLLRLEGLGALVAATWAFGTTGASWWLYAALLLLPDVAMAGYALGPGRGAAIYNLAHTYLGPLALAALGLGAGLGWAMPAALVWAAHVGLDRAMGYGLKYPSRFKATHLSDAPAGLR
jgi:hypothetical protein